MAEDKEEFMNVKEIWQHVRFAAAGLMLLVYFLAPFFGAPWRPTLDNSVGEIVVIVSLWTAISEFRTRRRIGKALGREAKDSDMVSLDTWMKVREAEQEQNAKKPIS